MFKRLIKWLTSPMESVRVYAQEADERAAYYAFVVALCRYLDRPQYEYALLDPTAGCAHWQLMLRRAKTPDEVLEAMGVYGYLDGIDPSFDRTVRPRLEKQTFMRAAAWLRSLKPLSSD